MSDDIKPYTYVLIRQDLSFEQQIVQACHASLEAGFAFVAPPVTSYLIVLTVPDQDALLAARDRLQRYGIACEMFFEPDNEMGYSALATEPLLLKKQRHLMKKYPLLRKNIESFAGDFCIQ